MPSRFPCRALALAAVAFVAACSAPPPQAQPKLPPVTPIMIPPPPAAGNAADLGGRTWAWQSTQFSDDKRVVAQAPERYTLEFLADGRVQLRADCNRGGTRFEAGANRSLTFSPAATTKMGCPRGSQDTEFLRELALVSGYLFVDGDLVLTLRADTGSMRFAPLGR
jgi:heat shock protein HslJ